MTTFNEIKKAAETKGFEVCLDYQNQIGVKNTKNKKAEFIWNWFKTYDETMTDNSSMFFCHSYNQNTGKSIKSFRRGFNVLISLGLAK